MKKILSFQTFEKYNPEFSELIVKNIMSGNKENVELWETINDLILELKRLGQIEIVNDLENRLLDHRDELKLAISAGLKSTSQSENLYKIMDKLKKIRKEKSTSEKAIYKVRNSIQANLLKELVEKSPYNCKTVTKALIVEVDCKKNSVEEIDLLLKELPFEVFKIS